MSSRGADMSQFSNKDNQSLILTDAGIRWMLDQLRYNPNKLWNQFLMRSQEKINHLR